MVVKGNRYLPRVLREGFNGFAQCFVRCELLLEGTALVVVATDDLDFEVGLYVLTEASQVGGEVVGLELGLEGIELGTCLLVASLEAGKLSQLCQRGGGAAVVGEVAGSHGLLEVGIVGIGDMELSGLGN